MYNQVIIILILVLGANISFCQEYGQREIDDFTIAVVIPEKMQGEVLDDRASFTLRDKIFNALSHSGVSGLYPNYSFVMFPMVTIVDKELTATAPTFWTMNVDVTLYVSDYENTTTFGNHYMTLKGVGKSELQAYHNAFKSFNPRNKKLQKFIEEAKLKILTYVDRNCDHMIAQAESFARAGHTALGGNINQSAAMKSSDGLEVGKNNNKRYQVDGRRKALSLLTAIDRSHDECYERALELMNSIYDELKNESCNAAVNKAKVFIANNQPDMAATALLQIPPSSECEDAVQEVLASIVSERKRTDDMELAIMIHKDQKDIKLAEIESKRVMGSAYMKYLTEINKPSYSEKGGGENLNIQINKN